MVAGFYKKADLTDKLDKPAMGGGTWTWTWIGAWSRPFYAWGTVRAHLTMAFLEPS